ncbi:MAG: hypothetical protein IJ083_07725 [Clostridia bacterium]|nr:hypothetical protein [Clostridia bacterium]
MSASDYKATNQASKKGFGFYATILALILSLAAGVYFVLIRGTFGLDSTHNGDCYDPLITYLLFGGAAVSLVLILLKKYGLSSAVTSIAPGVAICLFVHKCYWYVVDVFVGIDEKHGFDPRFIIFVALVCLAFVVGEVAIYGRKQKKVKA